MTYGLQVLDSLGGEVFSTSDVTWNYLMSFIAPANSSLTVTNVPVMPERLVTRQMLNQLTGDDEAYVHTYSLSGSTFVASPPSGTDTVATLFTIFGR
jgi:hypothetical protein